MNKLEKEVTNSCDRSLWDLFFDENLEEGDDEEYDEEDDPDDYWDFDDEEGYDPDDPDTWDVDDLCEYAWVDALEK